MDNCKSFASLVTKSNGDLEHFLELEVDPGFQKLPGLALDSGCVNSPLGVLSYNKLRVTHSPCSPLLGAW